MIRKRSNSTLRPGRRVECNVKGRVFTATLVGRVAHGLWRVDPDSSNVSYYHVNPRQITKVERATGRST